MRLMLDQILNLTDVALSLGLFVLSAIDFLGPNTVDYGVTSQKVDILKVIVSLRGSLEFFWRLTRVDTLQNAELAEVFERELQLTDGFSSTNVLDDFASLAGFESFHGC